MDKTPTLKDFVDTIGDLSPEALDDVLKFSSYLINRQTGKWLTPRQEINGIAEMLTDENIIKVRNLMRDIFYQQIQLEGPPKIDFKPEEAASYEITTLALRSSSAVS